MTGNVLLSGRDGPTLTASPTPNTGPDRTLGKDRWKKVEEGGRGWTQVEEEISGESRKSPVTEQDASKDEMIQQICSNCN